MLELTFGEQVKLVLNRKDMTIKQLAEMIEERTGKKMSRQNLTQRLARDNFQEQDMRLIASILECPFHLSILEENADSEYTARENIKSDKTDVKVMDDEPEQLSLNLEFDEPEPEQDEQSGKTGKFVPFEPERDITIGELVDIQEGLDQVEQADTEENQKTEYEPAYEEGPAYAQEPAYTQEPSYEQNVEAEYAENEYADQAGYEPAAYGDEPEYVENEYADQAGYEPEYETAYGDEPEYVENEYADQAGYEPEYETAYDDEPEYAENEYADQPGYEDEPQYVEEPEKQDDVSDILEEMAAIEAEEKKAREEREKEQEKEQEKPRGWRAYFPRRKKKQAEPVHEDKPETATEQAEPESVMNQAQPAEMTGETTPEEQYQETGEYQEAEQYPEEEQAYEEYVQENEQEMEEEFADSAQDWETPEEENVGEINPYTGMEYESNSVRMHPKRIGYVQVYDRSDHQWTDMTEWAFLGYQERKKALLGKDYEPPIYLD